MRRSWSHCWDPGQKASGRRRHTSYWACSAGCRDEWLQRAAFRQWNSARTQQCCPALCPAGVCSVPSEPHLDGTPGLDTLYKHKIFLWVSNTEGIWLVRLEVSRGTLAISESHKAYGSTRSVSDWKIAHPWIGRALHEMSLPIRTGTWPQLVQLYPTIHILKNMSVQVTPLSFSCSVM